MPASTTASTVTPAPFNNAQFVFHLNIFLFSIIGIFVLFSLPRCLARYSRASAWRDSHILRSGPPPSRTRSYSRSHKHQFELHPYSHRPPPSRKTTDETLTSDGLASDDSHTLYAHTPATHYLTTSLDAPPPGRSPYPPHVPAWSARTHLHAAATLLGRRVDLGLSLGQGFLLAFYAGALAFGVLHHSSPFTDPLRSGFVAVSQVPLVYALAARNGPLGAFLGIGYEKLNYLHRFAGKVLAILANIHALGYVYSWTAAGTFRRQIRRPVITWGVVALVAIDLLALTSTSYWRHRLHSAFSRLHIVGYVLFLPAIYYHGPSLIPYVYAAVGAYALDRLGRALKTRLCAAHLRPLPDLSMTRVEVWGVSAGWCAGQHVRLRVFRSGLWTESHPFTVASASASAGRDGEGEGLVLMCKRAGGWTNALYEAAKAGGYDAERGSGGEVRVVLEGPYGGPGHTVFASFSAAVFVVGGSGVSFALAAVQDLVRRDVAGASRVKAIELVWCVQDPASLTPLLPAFTALLHASVSPLRISVFYTRAHAHAHTAPPPHLPTGLTLTVGRPKLSRVLDAALTRCVTLGSGKKDAEDITGVVVGVCGPVGLGDDVAAAVGAVDARRRRAVGGIELHEEVFGW